MADLGLVTGTIRRARGSLPEMPLVNMFSEAAITEPRQFALLSFPGLSDEGTEMGNGPVIALLQKDGVLEGALVGVSAGSVYVGGSSVGALNGGGAASIAGNETGIVAAALDDASFWDGSAFSAVDFPDGAAVRKVFEQGGRFLFLRDGTQAFYWTEPLAEMLDGDGHVTVDALNFASAESEPDHLRDGLSFGNTVALFGTQSTERWSATGDSELPYTPIQGAEYSKGIRATGCAALFDNSFAWVSPDHIVYRAGNVPERISDAGIEELIAASTTCRVDSYFFEGHEFLKVGLDDLTIEFDAQTRQWNERRTGVSAFRGGPVVTGPLFGSNVDGKIYSLTGRLDLDGYQERSFCAGIAMNSGAVSIDNVVLRTNPGVTDYLEGDYQNPVVELIQSYDGGKTFDAALPEYLGEQGEYRREVEWRALGFADAPGFFAKFRVTAPIDWRVSGASFNEPQGGGRSR